MNNSLKKLIAKQETAIEHKISWGVDQNDFTLLNANVANMQWMRWQFASLKNVVIANKNFNHANLSVTDISNSEITNCLFNHVSLHSSLYTNVNFTHCDFSYTDFEQSEFVNCNLKNCWFGGTLIPRVRGLKTVNPVGQYGRLIYAYVFNGEIRIQAGCRNDTPDAVREAIMWDYEKGADRSDYLGAVKYLEYWGKAEIKRLKTRAK